MHKTANKQLLTVYTYLIGLFVLKFNARCWMLRLVHYVLQGKKPTTALFTTFTAPFTLCTTSATTSLNFPITILRKCVENSDPSYGCAIHAKIIKSSLPPSLYLYNHILNMYVKCGHLDSGLKLFDEMPQRNVVSWSAMIAGFSQRANPDVALSLFSRMHRDGVVLPNEFTLVSTVQACSLSVNAIPFMYQVYGYILRSGFESNIFLINAFLTALIRHERLLEAREVFDSCTCKDIVSWNAMMAGYLQHSYLQVPGFLYRMIYDGVKPDNFTFATVLTALAALSHLEMGLQIHGQIIKSGHGGEICVANSLCDMYIKNQQLVDGLKVFSEMKCTDVCSWTQIAGGSLQCGEPGIALNVIHEMREAGVMPNKFTLATAINACATLASLEEGKKFHGLRIKLGHQVDVCVDNSLIDMYAKCGNMDGASLVFQFLLDRTVVSWTTVIMGYAQNGQSREALAIFDEMRKKNVEPNYITFICLLYACSQGGFIDEGWRHFNSMLDHGISPGEDHYICMVNLLGRTGHIKEAEELILSMPFQPGALIWQTLLGACKLHGDIETGKRAAKHAMDLDVKDPSTYVLLSNMFAGFNNWESVGWLRKVMENRDVKKMPGSSWTDMDKVCSTSPSY